MSDPTLIIADPAMIGALADSFKGAADQMQNLELAPVGDLGDTPFGPFRNVLLDLYNDFGKRLQEVLVGLKDDSQKLKDNVTGYTAADNAARKAFEAILASVDGKPS